MTPKTVKKKESEKESKTWEIASRVAIVVAILADGGAALGYLARIFGWVVTAISPFLWAVLGNLVVIAIAVWILRAKRPSRIAAPGRKRMTRPAFPRYHRLAKVFLAVGCAGMLLAIVAQMGLAAWESQQFVVLVADFDGSFASRKVDEGRRIQEWLEQELDQTQLSDIRIIRLRRTLANAEDAHKAADQVRGRGVLVIWGAYDDYGMSPHLRIVSAPLLLHTLQFELPERPAGVTTDELREFELYVREDLLQSVTFFTSFAVGLVKYWDTDFAAAISYFNTALRNASSSEPEDVGLAYFYLGNAHFYSGNVDAALEAFDAAVDTGADFVSLLNNQAIALQLKGEWDRAKEVLLKIVDQGVDAPQPYNNLGFLLTEEGDFEQAEWALRKAIEIGYDSSAELAEAYLSLANALRFQGAERYAEAEAAYEQALALNPEGDAIYYSLGGLYFDWGDYTRAIDNYRIAVSKRSDKAHYLRALGRALFTQYRCAPEVEELFARAIDLAPTSACAHYEYGRCLACIARVEEAEQELSAALALLEQQPTPEWSTALMGPEPVMHFGTESCQMQDVLVWLGWSQALQGKFKDAEKNLQAAIKIQPHSAEAHRKLGATYFGMGKTQLAILEYEEALRLGPSDAQAYAGLSAAYVANGQMESALEAAQKAVELAPQSAQMHTVLGGVHQSMGNVEEAERQYKLAIQLAVDPMQRSVAESALESLEQD